MTDEESFQRMLDANPSDSFTRLVFADWLEERGDPRAAGYRWLGENDTAPRKGRWSKGRWDWDAKWLKEQTNSKLPVEMDDLMGLGLWYSFSSRADADNAFALTYPKLVEKWPDRFALKEHVG